MRRWGDARGGLLGGEKWSTGRKELAQDIRIDGGGRGSRGNERKNPTLFPRGILNIATKRITFSAIQLLTASIFFKYRSQRATAQRCPRARRAGSGLSWCTIYSCARRHGSCESDLCLFFSLLSFTSPSWVLREVVMKDEKYLEDLCVTTVSLRWGV